MSLALSKHWTRLIISTAIQRHNERESERLVGAVGGIYPLLDPKSEERPKANDKIGNYDFPQPAASPSGLDQFVAGFQSKNDGNNGAENLRTLPCAIDLAESGEKKENSGENSTGSTEIKANFCVLT